MRKLVLAGFLATLVAPANAQVTIEVASGLAMPGETVEIDVSLRTDRADVNGTGNNVRWQGPFSLGNCRVNAEISRPQTVFSFSPDGCESSFTCRSLRALVLSFSLAPPPIPDGAVLYTCDASIRADAPPGEYVLDCQAPEAATVRGEEIVTSCLDGVLSVPEPTPTVTPLPSATAASPVVTATPSATPSPTRNPCPGDCGGDGEVTIGELVASVRVALAQADYAVCPAADFDGNAVVTIGELIRAVRAALEGCTD